MPRGKTAEESTTESGGAEEAPMSMVEMLQEQQRAMIEQQRSQQEMLKAVIEQQRKEMEALREEMSALLKKATEPTLHAPKVKLPKPTIQKLTEGDDIEDYLAMFERVANQQGWPEDVWAMQLAGLLTGKAMAAFASLSTEESGDYEVKAAILQRYEVNEETHSACVTCPQISDFCKSSY